jgi:hypothetical protein
MSQFLLLAPLEMDVGWRGADQGWLQVTEGGAAPFEEEQIYDL